MAQTFVFYANSRLYQGLRIEGKLYKLIQYLERQDREQVFQIGYDLWRQHFDVVITASSLRYGVWANLDAPVHGLSKPILNDYHQDSHDQGIRFRYLLEDFAGS